MPLSQRTINIISRNDKKFCFSRQKFRWTLYDFTISLFRQAEMLLLGRWQSNFSSTLILLIRVLSLAMTTRLRKMGYQEKVLSIVFKVKSAGFRRMARFDRNKSEYAAAAVYQTGSRWSFSSVRALTGRLIYHCMALIIFYIVHYLIKTDVKNVGELHILFFYFVDY